MNSEQYILIFNLGDCIISNFNLDKEFKDSLLTIWNEMKKVVTNDSSDEFKNIKMEKIALNIYKNLKDNIPMENNLHCLETIHSVAIIFKDGSGFMVPHYFF